MADEDLLEFSASQLMADRHLGGNALRTQPEPGPAPAAAGSVSPSKHGKAGPGRACGGACLRMQGLSPGLRVCAEDLRPDPPGPPRLPRTHAWPRALTDAPAQFTRYDPATVAILDTPYVQRLRDVRQLSMACYVRPLLARCALAHVLVAQSAEARWHCAGLPHSRAHQVRALGQRRACLAVLSLGSTADALYPCRFDHSLGVAALAKARPRRAGRFEALHQHWLRCWWDCQRTERIALTGRGAVWLSHCRSGYPSRRLASAHTWACRRRGRACTRCRRRSWTCGPGT